MTQCREQDGQQADHVADMPDDDDDDDEA